MTAFIELMPETGEFVVAPDHLGPQTFHSAHLLRPVHEAFRPVGGHRCRQPLDVDLQRGQFEGGAGMGSGRVTDDDLADAGSRLESSGEVHRGTHDGQLLVERRTDRAEIDPAGVDSHRHREAQLFGSFPEIESCTDRTDRIVFVGGGELRNSENTIAEKSVDPPSIPNHQLDHRL